MFLLQMLNCVLIFYYAFYFLRRKYILLTVRRKLSKNEKERTKKGKTATSNNLPECCDFPGVSVIIPAHNEALTIVETVRSVLVENYNKAEIIVVDDGSEDRTSGVLIKTFRLSKINEMFPAGDSPAHTKSSFASIESISALVSQSEILPSLSGKNAAAAASIFFSEEFSHPIYLLRKAQAGKSAALNSGICFSHYSYVLCMDADSSLSYCKKNAATSPHRIGRHIIKYAGPHTTISHATILKMMTLVMESPETSALGGRLLPFPQERNLLNLLQRLEYSYVFNVTHPYYSLKNTMLLISGAFGLYRKEAIMDAGLLSKDTIGEDMDLIFRIQATSTNVQKVCYSSHVSCSTQAPFHLKDLMRQRIRWQLGLRQNLLKHRDIARNSHLFSTWLYLVLCELWAPYFALSGLIMSALSLISGSFRDSPLSVIGPIFLIILALDIYDNVSVFIACKKHFLRKLFLTLLLAVPMMIYHLFLSAARLYGMIFHKKYEQSWGTIRRSSILPGSDRDDDS